MNDRSATGFFRHRIFWGCVVLVAIMVPWIYLSLLAHDVLPGPIEGIDFLFGVMLVLSYVGLWGFVIVISRTPGLMGLRAFGTTFTVVVILLMLELPAMFKWVHWTLVFRSLSGEGADYQTAYVLDRELSFRRIPGLHWTGRPASDIEEAYGLPRSLKEPITFTYDRWGYRNATEMAQADIVLIGDSYVEGWYVSDEQTVASQLTTRLSRPVANLGIAGYGTIQEQHVLQGDAWNRRPQVIAWFFFEGNDLYDDQVHENYLVGEPPKEEEQTPHPEGLARNHGWEKRSFFHNAFRWIRRWSHPLVPNRAPYWAYWQNPGGSLERVYFFDYGSVPWTEYEESRWARARASFEMGLAFAREQGIEVILVYVPTKYRVYRDVIEVPPGSPLEHWDVWTMLPKQFRNLCTSVSIPCIDLTDRFQQAIREGKRVYAPTDTHWSAEGHAIVADELERVLRTLE